MPTCSECHESFTIKPGARGRPRRRCYTCSPERPGQYGRSLTRREQKEENQDNGQHCPWCGAYPPNGETFCNPQHRSFFAERVAAAQEERRIRHPKGPTK